MGVLWEDEAWQEYIDWQQAKKTLKKINRLVRDIQRNPFDGIGHPEPLSGTGQQVISILPALPCCLQALFKCSYHIL